MVLCNEPIAANIPISVKWHQHSAAICIQCRWCNIATKSRKKGILIIKSLSVISKNSLVQQNVLNNSFIPMYAALKYSMFV